MTEYGPTKGDAAWDFFKAGNYGEVQTPIDTPITYQAPRNEEAPEPNPVPTVTGRDSETQAPPDIPVPIRDSPGKEVASHTDGPAANYVPALLKPDTAVVISTERVTADTVVRATIGAHAVALAAEHTKAVIVVADFGNSSSRPSSVVTNPEIDKYKIAHLPPTAPNGLLAELPPEDMARVVSSVLAGPDITTASVYGSLLGPLAKALSTDIKTGEPRQVSPQELRDGVNMLLREPSDKPATNTTLDNDQINKQVMPTLSTDRRERVVPILSTLQGLLTTAFPDQPTLATPPLPTRQNQDNPVTLLHTNVAGYGLERARQTITVAESLPALAAKGTEWWGDVRAMVILNAGLAPPHSLETLHQSRGDFPILYAFNAGAPLTEQHIPILGGATLALMRSDSPQAGIASRLAGTMQGSHVANVSTSRSDSTTGATHEGSSMVWEPGSNFAKSGSSSRTVDTGFSTTTNTSETISYGEQARIPASLLVGLEQATMVLFDPSRGTLEVYDVATQVWLGTLDPYERTDIPGLAGQMAMPIRAVAGNATPLDAKGPAIIEGTAEGLPRPTQLRRELRSPKQEYDAIRLAFAQLFNVPVSGLFGSQKHERAIYVYAVTIYLDEYNRKETDLDWFEWQEQRGVPPRKDINWWDVRDGKVRLKLPPQ